MTQHDSDIIPHQDEVEQVIRQEADKEQLAAKVVIPFASVFTQDAAFGEPYGSCYLDEHELVCQDIRLIRAASVATTIGNMILLGSFIAGVVPQSDISSGFPGAAALIRKADNSIGGAGWVGIGLFDAQRLYFDPFVALSASVNQECRIPSLRVPLVDPKAAREAIAAL